MAFRCFPECLQVPVNWPHPQTAKSQLRLPAPGEGQARSPALGQDRPEAPHGAAGRRGVWGGGCWRVQGHWPGRPRFVSSSVEWTAVQQQPLDLRPHRAEPGLLGLLASLLGHLVSEGTRVAARPGREPASEGPGAPATAQGSPLPLCLSRPLISGFCALPLNMHSRQAPYCSLCLSSPPRPPSTGSHSPAMVALILLKLIYAIG